MIYNTKKIARRIFLKMRALGETLTEHNNQENLDEFMKSFFRICLLLRKWITCFSIISRFMSLVCQSLRDFCRIQGSLCVRMVEQSFPKGELKSKIGRYRTGYKTTLAFNLIAIVKLVIKNFSSRFSKFFAFTYIFCFVNYFTSFFIYTSWWQ